MICKRLQRSHLYKKRVATFELSTSEKYSFCSQIFFIATYPMLVWMKIVF